MVTLTAVFLDKDDKFLGTEQIMNVRTCWTWCGNEYELIAVVDGGTVARYRMK